MLVEDALFATLDPTVRRRGDLGGRGYTVADTVGFVRHLPHQLVEAFRSTLEEVAEADLILHVVDASDADPEGQLAAVREVLAGDRRRQGPGDRGRSTRPTPAEPDVLARLIRREPHCVVVSARTGVGIDELLAAIEGDLPRPAVEVDALIPYDRGDLISRIHQHGELLSETHLETGTRVLARVDAPLHAALAEYLS